MASADSVNEMASSSCSPFYLVPSASPIFENSHLATTASVSTSSSSTTKVPAHAVLRTFSAQAIVISPIQAVFLLIETVLLSTSTVASVSTRSGCKRSRDDKYYLPAKRFTNGGVFCVRAWELLYFENFVPSVQCNASGGRETSTVSVQPPAASTVSTPRMKVLVYMSRFRNWCDGCQFFSLALEGARPYVMIQTSCHDKTVGAWASRAAAWNQQNWKWILQLFSVSTDISFFRRGNELSYLQSLVDVMRSANKKWSFLDCL